ncbi:MAG: DUF1559 domain-containing protein [Pirellulales bacterium]
MGTIITQNHFRPDQNNRDNRGVFQISRYLSMAISDIVDGTSNTIMFGEAIGGGGSDDVRGGVAEHTSLEPSRLLGSYRSSEQEEVDCSCSPGFRPTSGRYLGRSSLLLQFRDHRCSKAVKLPLGWCRR